ncbi:hypothetical protein GCM10010298_65860 [Streptomyces microflavus]|uniref:Uncharacterized protein n=1 Tax=Streptomyces microflavus TaxID=1919 RepID=A0A7J0D1D3_STRMI|nr:hypothetical protein Smic_63830 [Streptomyces microflavus]GGX91251.1 hypothetical protein GCM10010298_65860 [Streptomyces microflavus]
MVAKDEVVTRAAEFLKEVAYPDRPESVIRRALRSHLPADGGIHGPPSIGQLAAPERLNNVLRPEEQAAAGARRDLPRARGT